jgi:flagellar biogenesis protein FliO
LNKADEGEVEMVGRNEAVVNRAGTVVRGTLSVRQRLGVLILRFFVVARDAVRSVKIASKPKSLRLCETLPLGDRRALMIVQIERRRFLLAATSQSITLLQRLEECRDSPNQSAEPQWFDAGSKRPH